MTSSEITTNGSEITLTGQQVKFIRTILGESQDRFARRLAVSGPVIHRLERKGETPCCGPEIILINLIAKQYGITVPDKPIRQVADHGAGH